MVWVSDQLCCLGWLVYSATLTPACAAPPEGASSVPEIVTGVWLGTIGLLDWIVKSGTSVCSTTTLLTAEIPRVFRGSPGNTARTLRGPGNRHANGIE